MVSLVSPHNLTMWTPYFALAPLFLGIESLAQSAASTYVNPAVPTGVAPTGNYSGQYRPQIHFSPPQVGVSLSGA
jgi:hypothetical protein